MEGLSRDHQPPEVGVLGVWRIIEKPCVVDGELAIRKVIQLPLAFDQAGSP